MLPPAPSIARVHRRARRRARGPDGTPGFARQSLIADGVPARSDADAAISTHTVRRRTTVRMPPRLYGLLRAGLAAGDANCVAVRLIDQTRCRTLPPTSARPPL